MKRRLAMIGLLTAALVAAGLLVHPKPAVSHAAPARAQEPAVPVVVIVDNTEGTWNGITQAAQAWEATGRVRFRFRPDCTDVRHYCAVVDAYNQRDSGWVGLTSPLTDRLAHVQLNTEQKMSPGYEQAVVCHELGHVLGIDDPGPDAPRHVAGCIVGTDDRYYWSEPTDADKAELARVIANGGGDFGVFAWERDR